MPEIGKMLVTVGVLVAVIGAIVWVLGRWGFRGLPGDIRVETANTRFYFPIVTCLVLSLLITGLMWLWQWLGRK